jgi:hypothetical protein
MSTPTPQPGRVPLPIDALAQMESAATPAPWRVVLDDTENATTVWRVCTSPDHPAGDDPDHIGVYDCCADGGLHSEPWYTEADAELVAAARNALPELIRMAREAERLRRDRDGARDALRRVQDRCDEVRAELEQWHAAYGESALPGALNLMKQRTRQLAEARAEVERLRELIAELYDKGPCQYDHHDQCQGHNLHPRPCPHGRAAELLATGGGSDAV